MLYAEFSRLGPISIGMAYAAHGVLWTTVQSPANRNPSGPSPPNRIPATGEDGVEHPHGVFHWHAGLRVVGLVEHETAARPGSRMRRRTSRSISSGVPKVSTRCLRAGA